MSSPIIYALLVSLLILLISAAVYGFYYTLRHRKQKKEYDLESCTAPETMKREFESSPLARPPLAYFTVRSSKHISAPIVRNLSALGHKSLTSLNASIPGSGTDTISRNTAPLRPPRPTQSDDFLASFPYHNTITSDVWFPIANQDTGHWDLCVVNATVTVASLGGYAASVVDPKSSHSRSIKAGEKNALKTQKAKYKRGGGKRKQAAPLSTLEIPELYVNARSYEDIEAEQTIADSDLRSYLEEEYDTNFLFPTYGLSESI